MPRTKQAKKKATRRADKMKAAEEGVASAQRVFAQILKKADPKLVKRRQD